MQNVEKFTPSVCEKNASVCEYERIMNEKIPKKAKKSGFSH